MASRRWLTVGPQAVAVPDGRVPSSLKLSATVEHDVPIEIAAYWQVLQYDEAKTEKHTYYARRV